MSLGTKSLRLILLGLFIMSAGCASPGAGSASGDSPELQFFKKVVKAAAKAQCGSRCSDRSTEEQDTEALRNEVDDLDRKIRTMENDFNMRCVRAGYVAYSPALKRCM